MGHLGKGRWCLIFFIWIQAYSILMVALTSDKTTAKDESVGLGAS